jgi:hypothetical protein
MPEEPTRRTPSIVAIMMRPTIRLDELAGKASRGRSNGHSLFCVDISKKEKEKVIIIEFWICITI